MLYGKAEFKKLNFIYFNYINDSIMYSQVLQAKKYVHKSICIIFDRVNIAYFEL